MIYNSPNPIRKPAKGDPKLASDLTNFFRLAVEYYKDHPGSTGAFNAVTLLPAIFLQKPPGSKSTNYGRDNAAIRKRLNQLYTGDPAPLIQALTTDTTNRKKNLPIPTTTKPPYKPPQPKALDPADPHTPTRSPAAIKRAQKAMQNADIGKASRLLHDDSMGIRTLDPTTIEPLLEKMFAHSDTPAETHIGPNDRRSLPTSTELFTCRDMVKQIRKLPNGKGVGINSYTYEFLKLLIHNGGEDSLHYILHTIAHNNLTREEARSILGLLLVDLIKPNGSDRPLLIEDCLLRAAGTCILHAHLPHFLPLLKPYNLGIGQKFGTTIASLVYTLFDKTPNANHIAGLPLHDYYIKIKLDIKNFFGNVTRAEIVDILMTNDDTKRLLPFFNLLYGSSDHVIFSRGENDQPLFHALKKITDGTFQGDKLACLFACLPLSRVMRKTQQDLNIHSDTFMQVAICDDLNFNVPASLAPQFLRSFAANLQEKKTGTIAIDKCAITCDLPLSDAFLKELSACFPSNVDARTGQPIQLIKCQDSTIYVGVPHGDTHFIHSTLRESLQSHTLHLNNLCELGDASSQSSFQLLRLCENHTLTSILQNVPPSITTRYAEEYDHLHQSLVHSLATEETAFRKTEIERIIFGLSQAQGGLGLIRLQRMTPFIFLAANLQAIFQIRKLYAHSPNNIILRLIARLLDPSDHGTPWAYHTDLHAAAAQFEQLHTTLNREPPDDCTPSGLLDQNFAPKILATAKKLFQQLDLARLGDLVDSSQRSSHLSHQQTGAGETLRALPTEPAFTFNNDIFGCLVRQTMLVKDPGLYPKTPSRSPISCPHCNQHVAMSTYHSTVCKGTSANIVRHDEIVREVANCARSASALVSSKTPAPLPGTKEKTDLEMWMNGDRSAYDVTVTCNTDPSTISSLTGSHNTPLYAATQAYKDKNDKHLPRHKHHHIKFVPLVLESDGAMHAEFERFIGTLATYARHALPSDANWSTPSFVRYWIARISCTSRRLTAKRITRDARVAHKIAFDRNPLNRGAANIPPEDAPGPVEYEIIPSFPTHIVAGISALLE